jgi:hypothetical protein
MGMALACLSGLPGLPSEPEAVVINTEIIRRDLGCDATAEE